MKARVDVRLKDGVLDPQGAAIGRALGQLGFPGVGAVRQGKLIELELDARATAAAAAAEVRAMCEQLLANPVIETYTVTLRATETSGGTPLRREDAVRAGVITFPGSNCDRDIAVALAAAGARVERLWHAETELPRST